MLKKENALLVLIDVQGRLFEQAAGSESLFRNLRGMLEGTQALNVPLIVTEQLPEKFGPTREELQQWITGPVISKSSFGCCDEPAFFHEIRDTRFKIRDKRFYLPAYTHPSRIPQPGSRIMIYLFLVSLLWAFSFGLIKGGLSGLPSSTVAFLRLLIAFAAFAPFLRIRRLPLSGTARLLLTGAIQYGLMYVAYIQAFQYLKAYEVALFTVFTPIYVTLINDLFSRRISRSALGAVVLAVAGGVIIKYQQLDSQQLWLGFALMQAANLCFAFGQIFYRRTMAALPDRLSDLQVFGLLYLGAALTAALANAGSGWNGFSVTVQQCGILLYLGVVASGLGFFLWNLGARRVSAGSLAVFNNLKIPLGILVSVLVFGEEAEWVRLVCGGALMAAALTVNTRQSRG